MRLTISPRRGLWLALVGGAFAAALAVPIPAAPDPGRDGVLAHLRERLPGWQVERIASSWENAYTVVAACQGRELGFQFVPEHGLPPGDAWLHPQDAYSRARLSELSDHYRYLIWYGDPALTNSLSCRDDVAHDGSGDPPSETVD